MKRLYRNKSDVMIAGVCSGIGKYLDVDPTAIRLAFVLLLFVGLGGLWMYLVLWIIMPEESEQEKTLIEVEPAVKTPEPKKAAALKKPAVKKTAAKKEPAKKPAAKQAADKSPSTKKPTSRPGEGESIK